MAEARAHAGRPPRLALAGIISLGLALRLIRLNFQPLWFDEGYSFYFANSALPDLLARTSVDIHPPLYYLLLKVWLALLGGGAAPARWLSVCIGVATIPLLYGLGRRLAGERAGVAAALLLALSPFHIYYSQEVRMYGLVALLTAAAGLLTLRAAEGRGGWPWVWAGLALLAALYTQYYACFIALALTLYLLLRRDLRPRLRPWLFTLAGVALAYLPWLLYAGPRLWVYIQYKVGKDADLPLSAVEFLRRALVALGAGHLEGWAAAWQPAALLPTALIIALLLVQWRRRAGWRGVGFALVCLLVPLAGAYLVNLAAPFNPPRSERLLLMALPAFCLLLGQDIGKLLGVRSLLRFVAPVALAGLALSAFYTTPRYPNDDYRPLIAEVGRRALPADAVVCVWPWQIGYFQAYLGQRRPALLEAPGQMYPQPRQFWADDPARMRRDLDGLLAAHGRIWLPAYLAAGSSQEAQITAYLDQLGPRALSDWYGTTHLTLHVTPPAFAPLAGAFEFAGRLGVSQLELGGMPAAGEGFLALRGRWEKRGPLAGDYHIALRLSDAAGRSWGQWDAEPFAGQRPFAAWDEGESHFLQQAMLIEAGTPPGVYELRLSVRNEAAVPLPATAGVAEPGAEVVLAAVNVSRPTAPLPPESLPIFAARPAVFADSVKLLGYSAGTGPFTPGDKVNVTLFWQALAAPGRELIVFVQLLDGAGRLVAATEAPPTDGLFPTGLWQPADLIRDPHALPLSAGLPNGSYRLIAGLFDAQDKGRLTTRAGLLGRKDYVELGRVTTRGRPHDFAAPTPAQALDARFGDVARLVGFAWAPEAGGARLTLYWQALRETDRSYKIFVHAYDAAGRRIGQHDGVPGALPTTGWLAGEYIADEHRLDWGGETAPQTLWVGLYDEESGARLTLVNEAGRQVDHLVIEVPGFD